MRFGVAKEVITPSFQMKIACSGLFDKDFEYIHDDVYVRCLVMDDGGSKAVFFAFDMLFHDRELNRAVEEYAEGKYGIKKSAVIVACTHDHTSLASKGYNPNHHSEKYEEFIVERAKSCLDRALCAMFDGYIEYGSFDEFLNISRRGIVNGAYANFPNPSRERDTEFGVICVRDLFGNIRSVLMDYACHPVFYPAKSTVSGEFPARLCQLMDTAYYGCTSLFFQSAGGDVRPSATVVDGKFVSPLPFSVIDSFAHEMCEAVCEYIGSGKMTRTTLSIASDAFTVEMPVEERELSAFEDALKMYGDNVDNPNAVNARLILNGGYQNLPSSVTLYCQTVRIGADYLVAAVGGEPCLGVKKAIVHALRDYKVLFIGYTDACAYVVSDDILDEGGYEACCYLEYGHKGPFKKGLDKLYIDAFESSIKNMRE